MRRDGGAGHKLRRTGSSMSDGWYFGDGAENIGPLTFDELVESLRARDDWASVPVWHEDLDDWRPARDIEQIALALKKRRTAPPASRPAALTDAALADAALANNEGSSRRRLIVAIILAVIVLGAIAAVVASIGPKLPSWLTQASVIRSEFTRIIESNRALPKQLDEWTTLVEVTSSDNRLTYHHVL